MKTLLPFFALLFLCFSSQAETEQERLLKNYRVLQRQIQEAKVQAIVEDDELIELHRKIMRLHKKMAEKLEKKDNIKELESRLKRLEVKLKK